jgi:hypothetical protein
MFLAEAVRSMKCLVDSLPVQYQIHLQLNAAYLFPSAAYFTRLTGK